MVTKQQLKNHLSELIAKTGFKKQWIAARIEIRPEQLTLIINGHRIVAKHREALFCFLKHYLDEIKDYKDVWLEDRPGTIYF